MRKAHGQKNADRGYPAKTRRKSCYNRAKFCMLIKPRPVLSFHDQELDMDHELNVFEKMVEAACARVGAIYFQLPVADADAMYRERVYCYELYHQLRSGNRT